MIGFMIYVDGLSLVLEFFRGLQWLNQMCPHIIQDKKPSVFEVESVF